MYLIHLLKGLKTPHTHILKSWMHHWPIQHFEGLPIIQIIATPLTLSPQKSIHAIDAILGTIYTGYFNYQINTKFWREIYLQSTHPCEGTAVGIAPVCILKLKSFINHLQCPTS